MYYQEILNKSYSSLTEKEIWIVLWYWILCRSADFDHRWLAASYLEPTFKHDILQINVDYIPLPMAIHRVQNLQASIDDILKMERTEYSLRLLIFLIPSSYTVDIIQKNKVLRSV